jgi:hypothetical protein
MIDCSHHGRLPILVAASDPSDSGLSRSAIEELGLMPVLVQETAEAIRHLCARPKRYGAVIVGERIGPTTGFTLCGVGRDAGCRIPMLLLTSDACRWTAVRAARLQVSVLWQPVPARRIAQVLLAMLPRRSCIEGGGIRLPVWPNAPAEAVPAAIMTRAVGDLTREADRWRPARNSW